MNRRQMLACASFALAGSVGGGAWRRERDDERLAAILERHASELRTEWGEAADPVGDRSLAGRAGARLRNARRLADLAEVNRDSLSLDSRLGFDTARFVYETLEDQLGRPGTVDLNLRPSPYVVSQMNGAYYWLPSRIGAQAATAGPEGYLEVIAALARGIDEESERIGHDAAGGVVPPIFVLSITLGQVRALRDSEPSANPLLAQALNGEEPATARRAAERFEKLVVPALDRQIQALESTLSQAGEAAGVWALPDGEALYASSLRANTTVDLEPGSLHQAGLEWVRELSSDLDRAFAEVGMTSGSAGERIAVLNEDARFIQPDTDEGRAGILCQGEALLALARRRLPDILGQVVDAPVEVRRMPVTTEASSPIAFYNGGAQDAPGTVLLNLKTPRDLPSWRLPTLIHHEGVPGHHTQAAVLQIQGGLPLFRRTVRFSAWTEGWALYAERLADEIGLYESDPYGRIGYLQAQLWRAARVVVDTGIHHERWTRERAIRFMVDEVGELRGPTEREVDRYCVYPGQACCFMVGQRRILAARDAARQAMGARFDGKAFNDLILRSGPLPMGVLGDLVEQWSQA